MGGQERGLGQARGPEPLLGERGSPRQGLGGKVTGSGQARAWGGGAMLAKSSPEVLDANHLTPGPGAVHGPPVRICALARSRLCERSGHMLP